MDIFRYYELESNHFQSADKSYNSRYNKLRLDRESILSDEVMMVCNINFQLPYGKTEWDFFDIIPMDKGEVNGQEFTSFTHLLVKMVLNSLSKLAIRFKMRANY